MLRSRKNDSNVNSSYICESQNLLVQKEAVQIFRQATRERCWKPVRRIIKLGKLLSAIQYFLVLFLSSTNIIHQTETNTRNIFKRKLDLSLSEDNLPIELKTFNGVEKFLEMKKGHESRRKFKVSPTRIRFSNVVDHHVDKKIIAPNNAGNEQMSKEYESLLTNSTNVGFSDKRYKSSKQMAPAYELWPDTSKNKKYVLNSKENTQNNDYANSIHDTDSRLYNNHPNTQIQTTHNPKLHITNLNLKSLRGLLPRPLPVEGGSTLSRVLRERSTLGESDDESSSDGKREEVDERADKANLDQDKSELDRLDYTSKSNDDEDGGDDERIFTQNPNHRQISFQVLDSRQALGRVQRRKLIETQIYPPGDPTRLYADALLVYVKDFNRYIKA